MDNSPDRTKLRMWFAFGLRLLGFWEILTAAGYFITGLNITMGFTKPMAGQTSFGSYMTHVFGHLILALWLVNGAPSIAQFIYPDRPTEKNDSTGKTSDSNTPTSNQWMTPTIEMFDVRCAMFDFSTTPGRGLSPCR